MKKLLVMILWIGMLAYMLVILGMVNNSVQEIPCQTISVRIQDSLENRFVSGHDVYSLVLAAFPNILGSSMGEIHTGELEEMVRNYPFIKAAEAFKGTDGILFIQATQRKPVVRIADDKGGGFYIDSEGFTMPLSHYYTARVLVANGPGTHEASMGIDLHEYRETRRYKTLWEIYILASYIYFHEFWNVQIEQIHVDGSGDFELVPRVGAHSIVFGGQEDYKEKFEKLYALYEQGLKVEGWNTYKKINLKYKDQVVCTKR